MCKEIDASEVSLCIIEEKIGPPGKIYEGGKARSKFR